LSYIFVLLEKCSETGDIGTLSNDLKILGNEKDAKVLLTQLNFIIKIKIKIINIRNKSLFMVIIFIYNLN
jgi:hypothetical protein